jgi:twitching motility two-component system response regulator PilH
MSDAQTVLIIEDDPWQADQYRLVLEASDYIVKIFDNGVAAIEAIDRARPDVIVLDMLLPGTTGLTLMHELQSYSDTGNVPVILCTNLADQVKLEDVAPYGVERILDKATMQPYDLVTAVRSVLL